MLLDALTNNHPFTNDRCRFYVFLFKSTHADSSQVVLRQKHHHPHHQQVAPGNGALNIEEDERKTRRISYLRATATENLFQMMESSDPSDSSPMSLPADTPDTEPEGGTLADIGLQQQQQQQQQLQPLNLQPSQQALSSAGQQPQQLKRYESNANSGMMSNNNWRVGTFPCPMINRGIINC